MQKQVQYIIKGMNRDMTVSKFPADHSFENLNIRITQSANQTLLSLTNEKGPEELVLSWDTSIIYENSLITSLVSGSCIISGNILGHCAIRQYIVLFVRLDNHEVFISDDTQYGYRDAIYRIDLTTGKVVVLLYTKCWEYTSKNNEILNLTRLNNLC